VQEKFLEQPLRSELILHKKSERCVSSGSAPGKLLGKFEGGDGVGGAQPESMPQDEWSCWQPGR